MAIQFTCAACGQPIEVDDEMANQAVTCPYCRKEGMVPAASTLEAGAVPPAAEPPAAEAAAAGSVAVLSYASEGPPVKKSVLGWVALACIVASILCLGYISLVTTAMVQDLNLKPTTPEEVEEFQKTIATRMQSKPALKFLTPLGSCVFPLAGVVCAIITLVRRSRPRWPAILALALVGVAMIFMVVATVISMGMAGQGAGG